ncbi:hypothetical protein DPMN_036497 [Dreissena polymorpha]|uniref:C2H2-type domain-containing protein n=2 Tax=Dreissena polymorpha TaxID=45954 RepID=A0A9D4MDP3_DREPO|nr:hypothetical protein DPMN_036497 [Dreissena polymorpha]
MQTLTNLQKGDIISVEYDDDTEHKPLNVGMVATPEERKEDMDDSDMEYFDYDEITELDSFVGTCHPHDEHDICMTEDVSPVESKDLKNKQKKANENETVKKGKKKQHLRVPKTCEYCGLILSAQDSLNKHISRMHLKVRNRACTICPMKFFTKTHLDSHTLSVHTRVCRECKAYVVESVPWTARMDKRMVRKVLCACGEIVNIVSVLGKKRTTTGEGEEDGCEVDENEFTCKTCGQSFDSRHKCLLHISSHSEIKTGNVCSLCGMEFLFESSLTKHLEEQHGIVKHQCKFCGKKYGSGSTLKVHYVKVHKGMLKPETGADEEKMGHLNENSTEMSEYSQSASNNERKVEGFSVPQANPSINKVLSELGPGQTMITEVHANSIYVATRNPNLSFENAQEFVKNAIRDGLISVPAGEISIVLKQLP